MFRDDSPRIARQIQAKHAEKNAAVLPALYGADVAEELVWVFQSAWVGLASDTQIQAVMVKAAAARRARA